MTFFDTLAAAFKGGGGAARVPLSAGPPMRHAAALGAPPPAERFDYTTALEEAFARNAVAQRAIRIVAEGVGSAPLTVTPEPVAALFGKGASGGPLLETLAAHLLLHGNAWAQIVRDGAGMPVALCPLRPERMEVVPGADGWPVAARYHLPSDTREMPLEDAQGWPALVHWRALHPANDHYGGGCLSAAHQAVAIHNAASAWNRALLENAARPSGALIYRGEDAGGLTREQFDRLSEELTQAFAGERNAGRPMLLEGGLSWQSLSLSPADMDFATLKAAAARDIALAFGVPPMLLGLPGDNTYSNYREANRALWRLTLLPLADKLLSGLADAMTPWFPDARLEVDLDRVPALAEDRERLWAQVASADFLTRAEKRDLLGLPPIADGAAATNPEVQP
ncbi:phage portal protein [Erythrobacteraceae bacterium CFH 75059]|uniref:phage portal protein n=1 Tax=Qipengyuania thermophila TaxID=2509361 RepID=UPI00102180E4|nr:phage portal protein [Qipengyuania thermophila]TCD06851.1 phage portal protein [Erythrobacteraceae bacterium CFH 75059]